MCRFLWSLVVEASVRGTSLINYTTYNIIDHFSNKAQIYLNLRIMFSLLFCELPMVYDDTLPAVAEVYVDLLTIAFYLYYSSIV